MKSWRLVCVFATVVLLSFGCSSSDDGINNDPGPDDIRGDGGSGGTAGSGGTPATGGSAGDGGSGGTAATGGGAGDGGSGGTAATGGGGGLGGNGGSGGIGGSSGSGGSDALPYDYIKASNTEPGDGFGRSVSLSADGHTLAVGATNEDSAAAGINGDQSDNSASGAGAVYVLTRSIAGWTQEAYIKASNPDAADFFGRSVSLSADGHTLAVGATGEDSAARGINVNQTSNAAENSGAVYVFTRAGTSWSQQAYLKGDDFDTSHRKDFFGNSVSLSADGNTLAVGAPNDGGASSKRGIVYIFKRDGDVWRQQTRVSNIPGEFGDRFGGDVSLSADGNTLAVGANFEDSRAVGIWGDQFDDSKANSGAAYVFTQTDDTWTKEAYIKASNTDPGDRFGSFVSLSADGNTLAVGAPAEDSVANEINGDQGNFVDPVFGPYFCGAGAVYVFVRNTAWSQQAYIKANNAGCQRGLGRVSLAYYDGNTLAAGDARAPYVFARSGVSWSQNEYIEPPDRNSAIALSGDGTRLVVGARLEDEDSGAVYVYELD